MFVECAQLTLHTEFNVRASKMKVVSHLATRGSTLGTAILQ
jgi:hypothetical protein